MYAILYTVLEHLQLLVPMGVLKLAVTNSKVLRKSEVICNFWLNRVRLLTSMLLKVNCIMVLKQSILSLLLSFWMSVCVWFRSTMCFLSFLDLHVVSSINFRIFVASTFTYISSTLSYFSFICEFQNESYFYYLILLSSSWVFSLVLFTVSFSFCIIICFLLIYI